MRNSKRHPRWTIAIVVGAIVLVGLGIGYYRWYWPSEQGWRARKNAKTLKVQALPILDAPIPGDSERIRAKSPGSPILYLDIPDLENHHIYEIDTVGNKASVASNLDWESATGEIIGELPYDYDARDIRPLTNPQTVGRHLRRQKLGPQSDKVAIFSADGRLHPQGTALIPGGGRAPYADGQRYIEVQSLDWLTQITSPVAIPSPCIEEPGIWWTADERFIVCRYSCSGRRESIVLVPTGLEIPSILRSGNEAKVAGYGVFQADLWWEEWLRVHAFQLRKEHEDSAALLFNMPVQRLNTPDGFLVYRYDPSERTLLPVEDDVWLQATGLVFNESMLLPEDERDPKYEAARQNRDRTPEDREVLRKEGERSRAAEERRATILKKSPPVGSIVLGPFFSPDGTHYATRSYDDKESKTFFHEVFNAKTGAPNVDLLELPKSLGEGPLWTPDGRYILYHNQWTRMLTIIHSPP